MNEKTITIQFKEENRAPITAKVEKILSEQIKEKAEECQIPLDKNEELVALLSQVQIDAAIPSDLYQASAQIITLLYKINDNN